MKVKCGTLYLDEKPTFLYNGFVGLDCISTLCNIEDNYDLVSCNVLNLLTSSVLLMYIQECLSS